MAYENDKQPIFYTEKINTIVSRQGSFVNYNELLEKLFIKIKPQTDKEQIFSLYKECIHFGEAENVKINRYIKSISVKEKNNIFDYYA